MDRYNTLATRTKEEFPRFRVKKLSQSLLGLLFRLYKKVTRQDSWGFTITLFSTVYVADDWDRLEEVERYKTLRHEKIHIGQFHSWPLGRWVWPLNHLLMALAYLFLLPALYTLRARFERAGYVQSLLVDFELQGRPFTDLEMETNARFLVVVFSTATYFFMWRKKATYLWAMETQRRINAKEIQNPTDRVEEADRIRAVP